MKHTQLFNEFLNESQTFVDESSIGDIHIMAQDADSFTAFRKEFMDEYGKPTSVKELKQLEAWLQTIWKENETNESVMKYTTTFEGFVNEGKDIFPNEVVGNDQILFKKEWEKMNGGKLAAKYNQYYKGYDIDFGGRIFNTVDQLEKYIKSRELSNNEYSKYKYMPEIPIKESVVNEEESYKVTKNTYRDYDTLNITQFDSIQFKEDGKKWIVRVVTCHDNVDKGALQKLGFTNQGETRYGGISHFTKNANWHDLELTKKEFDQLIKIVDSGWKSHAKAFADFYKDRQAD